MENQIYLNILISLILATSISYFYLRKFNTKFLTYSLTIFLISFTILYYLGPQHKETEFFHNPSEEENTIENAQEEVMTNTQEEVMTNTQEELNYPSEENYTRVNTEMSEELNQEEESKQEEELNQQEEHIRNSIEESNEEENSEEEEEIKKTKSLENNNFLRKIFSGNNNQVNPGIGIGVSPVNIYINGDKTSVDKFKNNKGNSNNSQNNKCDNNDDNYYKKASRIYNNSDWVYDKPQWCNNDSNDEKYNYDKNDYLLPDNQTKANVNKIPQTLNNSINSKKPKNNSEPCPLDVNKPWSIFKTGDDKENNELIPEGFNL